MTALPLFRKKRPEAKGTESSAPQSGAQSAGRPGGAIRDDPLLRAHVTEKATKMQSDNSYTFVVRKTAAKAAIRRAVEEKYGVKVESVNTANISGKRIRFRGRMFSRAGFKKAMVTLRAGDKIELT